MDFINQMQPTYGNEEKEAVVEYLNSGGWIMEFKKTREFEKMICEYTNSKYCSVVPNGTISLFIALYALGIKDGDEVIVPDYTMIATPNAVKLCGAKPILVDIEKESLCISLNEIKKNITNKTKAVIHVSINGRAGDLDIINNFCKGNGIYLIEDAAQSFGSFFNGIHLGNYGKIGCFSFSVPKIITTGQGGALITDDEDLYKKICKIKDFGRISGGIDIHDDWGWNFKFTDLQAVFGIEQLKKINNRTKRKKEIYSLYENDLANIKEISFIKTDSNEVSPWFIDILVDDPKKLSEYLKVNGIGSRPFYPPISDQIIYKDFKNDFPITKEISYKGLWLPSFVSLTDTQIHYICDKIKEFYRYN